MWLPCAGVRRSEPKHWQPATRPFPFDNSGVVVAAAAAAAAVVVLVLLTEVLIVAALVREEAVLGVEVEVEEERAVVIQEEF